MSKKLSLLILLLAAFVLHSFGQFNGKVEIIQDPLIDTLIQRHIQINQLQPTIEGYRIQIYFESGNQARTLANRIKERFEELYPDYGAYLTFNEPYYRVRVGDFRDKMSAEAFRQILLQDFPNAFIVPDNVYFEKIQN
ncbi:MAG TPA: SPOR domain-containing protein [Bacteroidales bacterium]|jgi:hypothetical protein|nr:SPOR domain-containing protein [Bacteroidales bacterium]MDI9573907.1 SPOR domain-containing protein [Bacteroidota bacterium]OQC60943.1 MAG: Sporulation related domain protein [Bacteroidetes bacterium ADurb.Bin012]MBP9512024.1 SPOR domain-containing protein [Bacteroidales bacterium]MBP9588496.1 SPOR domain-containing protein [Bacteroidales bacterium]